MTPHRKTEYIITNKSTGKIVHGFTSPPNDNRVTCGGRDGRTA